MIEHRITKMEVLIEALYHRSDERLTVITDRFDGIDSRFDRAERRANWFWTCLITAAITMGGVYLEAVFSKNDNFKSVVVARDERV